MGNGREVDWEDGEKRVKMHTSTSQKVSCEGEVCEFLVFLLAVSGWEMKFSDGKKRADGSLVRVT